MNKNHIIFKKLLKTPISIADDNYIEYCSSEDLIRFLIEFVDKDIVRFEKGQISLTESGQKWVIINKSKLYLSKKEKSWEVIPPEYRIEEESFSMWSKLLK